MSGLDAYLVLQSVKALPVNLTLTLGLRAHPKETHSSSDGIYADLK